MRLLHIRPDHVGGGALKRTVRAGGCGRERIHERQYLPVRGVSEHCRCHSKCAEKCQAAETRMKTFALTRANDSAQAIATAAKATTAQQGAEIRFIGGGTTLIDLMKLNVEQPNTLIDINRLPLDKIDMLPDGGLTIGAVVRNSDLAHHPIVRKNYAVLSEALLSGETVLEPGDLITHVTLPPPAPGSRSLYLKLRDRASYEFALASAAVVVTVANGKITRARIALGGVGTKPWRSTEAEGELTNQTATQGVFQKAADAALRDAKPQSQNGFKVELAKRCLVHALKLATKAA